MSKNSLLKFVVAFGLLAILLAFLGVNYVPRISASSSNSASLVDASIQARQNYVNERYPRSLAPQLSAAGSDYFERHATELAKTIGAGGSEFLNHHPFAGTQLLKYAGSDYFERHATELAKTIGAGGSEFLNHHPFVDTQPLNLATPAAER